MTKTTAPSFPRETIGLDIGDRFSQMTLLDQHGQVVQRLRIKTSRQQFAKFFQRHRGARVVYEVGPHSLWVTWLLESIGCETVVANPRAIPIITHSKNKNDTRDADLLAELGYFRPSLLEPIRHRGPESYKDRALLTARNGLVQCRTSLINSVRGLLKAIGVTVAAGSAPTFHRHAAAVIPEELCPALQPVLDQIRSLSERIRDYDKQIDHVITECYPEALRLQQVPGVGPVTSLAFVLTIEDPTRFKRSRDVGSYFGLVPKRRQSGASDPELRITKAGDRIVRSLLVQCAQYILGPFGKDCDLRRFGERIAQQGAKLAKRRAVVAVARKVAVLLHSLWVHGTDYEPLRNATEAAA